MLFSSLEFLVLFLPLTLAVALLLRGQPLLRWIAFSSIVFYAFAGHWFAKLAIAGTVLLSLWSTAHRLRITCYDLGVRADTLVATIVYAGALAGTAASVFYLVQI